jgi:O-succinylbenzoic acid--CoA ligase
LPKKADQAMGKIIINGQEFSFQQIKENQWQEQRPYFQTSLSFCHDWLNGKPSFELHSSGSTGRPKTIQVSRAQMSSSATATGNFFGIRPEANLLCCLNTAMIAGKMMLVRAMEWDSQLYLVEPASNPLLGFATDQHFDFGTMVPLQLETCLEDAHSRDMLGNIRHLLIGGAPLGEVLRKKAIKLPIQLFQTYGMTETVSHIALADLKAVGPLTYQPLPDVQIRQSSEGSLEIKAPMSNHQWISTNDVVELLPNGRFIWIGRADFTINTGGVKVQPEEVEKGAGKVMVRFFPGQRYFVTALPDSKLGQKVVLMIEGKQGNQDPQQVLEALKRELPPYHSPKNLLFVPKFTETASHKISRQQTLERWKALTKTAQ